MNSNFIILLHFIANIAKSHFSFSSTLSNEQQNKKCLNSRNYLPNITHNLIKKNTLFEAASNKKKKIQLNRQQK